MARLVAAAASTGPQLLLVPDRSVTAAASHGHQWRMHATVRSAQLLLQYEMDKRHVYRRKHNQRDE